MVIPVVVHKTCVYSSAAISLFCNCLLLLLLSHRCSNALGNYRWLLATFAVADILISALHAWYIPMFILCKFGFLFFGYGSLFLSGNLVSLTNVVYGTTYFIPFLLLGMHFVYRYLSLARPSLVKENFGRFLLFCVIYFFGNVVFITYLAVEICNMNVSARFGEDLVYYGNRQNSALNVAAIEYLDVEYHPNLRAILYMAGATAIVGHTIILSIACILKIIGGFKDSVMEIRVRKLHIQLFRALLLQFSIPFLFSYLPFTVISLLPLTGISLGQTGNVCALLGSMFPALDPILIILSISRFRATLREWVDTIRGRKAQRNEQMAKERSRAHTYITKQRGTMTA